MDDFRTSTLTGVDADTREAARSAVSWPAIFAGALAAAAMSLILVALGSGIGLASVSPWPNAGASSTTVALGAVIWFIVVQWVSSALGGYLTGHLRTRWVGVHTHAVFFRDTVHGFLAWSLATLLVTGILASSAFSFVGGATHAVATGAAQGAAQSASPADPSAYAVDVLFRSGTPDAAANPADAKAETIRILAASARNGGMSPGDRSYLAGLVSTRAGISQQDAERRIDQLNEDAKAAAEKARKAAMKLSLLVFFSLMLGAFIASAAAALGGQERDEL